MARPPFVALERMDHNRMRRLPAAAQHTPTTPPGGLVLAPCLPLGCHEDLAEGHCMAPWHFMYWPGQAGAGSISERFTTLMLDMVSYHPRALELAWLPQTLRNVAYWLCPHAAEKKRAKGSKNSIQSVF